MSWVFRYQRGLWILLLGLLGSSVWLLPKLEWNFSVQETLRPGHPVREAAERYRESFGIQNQVLVFFHGQDALSGPFLDELEVFSEVLVRRREIARTLSPLDLYEPVQHKGHLRSRQLLNPRRRSSPEALAAFFQSPAAQRWERGLYDSRHQLSTLVVVPRVDERDPFASVELVAKLEAEIRQRFAKFSLEVHFGGIFYLNQEALRTSVQDQLRLTGISLGLQLILMRLVFGSFSLAFLVLLLLAWSIHLTLNCVAALGIPMNILSGNLPVMIGVIGTADIIHILGAFQRARERAGPRRAALMAMRKTALPNLWTTLTTLGCVLLSALSPLKILVDFSFSLSLGVAIVYLVTIVYGPLLLSRIQARPQGQSARLRARLEGWLRGPLLAEIPRPRVLGFFALFTALVLFLVSKQSINSNGYRKFVPGHPVIRTLDFLHQEGQAVNSVEFTLETTRRFDQLVQDKELRREFAALEAELQKIPEVLGIGSFFQTARRIDEAFDELEFPASLTPPWIEARRQSAYRTALDQGFFEPYFNPVSGRLRFALSNRLEDSLSFSRLAEEVQDVFEKHRPKSLGAKKLEAAGGVLLWTEIIRAVTENYYSTLLGSLGILFVSCWWISGRVSFALLSWIPNLLPVLSLYALAYGMGQPLNEDLVSITAISLGIAVDDTLHVLYHYGRARAKRLSPLRALEATMATSGAPIVLTSACLMAGFVACIAAEILPIHRTAAWLGTSILVALLADLFLLPALLFRLEGLTGAPTNGESLTGAEAETSQESGVLGAEPVPVKLPEDASKQKGQVEASQGLADAAMGTKPES